ncbi:MAG: discoidin domain-containing protein [Candidatus Pseudobacter hemicellulosilyticus]|uniref:Discoidin domain-containing protein n=1 Tax=Candidatus Pseudobacter hemicellulosilyticus TaxID=3121375 RepID=A0AAJ5WNM6_9BACT|nr:MAG: discoidin domain-containing protein [Pseudobacter sp.]
MFANKLSIVCSLLLLTGLSGCEKEYDLPSQPIDSYTKIYMPQAVTNPAVYELSIADTAQYLTYSASFGGQDYPGSDIPVTFVVSNELIDSFNLANGTSYAALPEKSYVFSTASAIIPAGKLSTGPLSIGVTTDGNMDMLTDYLLPISIGKAGEKVNDKLRTTFFKVRAQPDLNNYPPYDRSGWSIVDFSSQEANGEGANNGRAVFVLDDNTATFWHTQWQGASPAPPHHITVDMGEVKTVHGLYFTARQSADNGKPRDVQIQLSTDNSTWITAREFTLANTKELQYQFLKSFTEARYVKMIVLNTYSSTVTHLADLKVF